MSDTRKAPHRDTDHPANRTRREAAQASEEIAQRAEGATQRMAGEMEDTAGTVTDTISRQVDAATEVSQQVADQGRDVLLMGMRAAAGVNGRIVDIGYGRGHRVLTATAQAMDIYRDAAERSAEQMQALFGCYLTLGRGLWQMQHAMVERLDQTVDHAGPKPQDLLRCKSLVELAEVQRDLYLNAVSLAFETSSDMLRLAGRSAQEAIQPLQRRG
jgi:phage major head subunit gpT-like protein